jgi:hypothetical protein
VFEDLRAVDIRLDGVDRLFDDQSDTHSRSEMKDDVRVIDQLRQKRLVVHGFNVITDPERPFRCAMLSIDPVDRLSRSQPDGQRRAGLRTI